MNRSVSAGAFIFFAFGAHSEAGMFDNFFEKVASNPVLISMAATCCDLVGNAQGEANSLVNDCSKAYTNALYNPLLILLAIACNHFDIEGSVARNIKKHKFLSKVLNPKYAFYPAIYIAAFFLVKYFVQTDRFFWIIAGSYAVTRICLFLVKSIQ
jgi:hypothetical protein